jgi:signal transduction histidine kinase
VTERSAVRVTWTVWALVVVAYAVHFVPGVRGAGAQDDSGVAVRLVFGAFVLSFATVGALVASRKPSNPIGWLLLAAAVAYTVAGLATGVGGNGGSRPSGLAVAQHLIGQPLYWGGVSLALVTLLLFPTGSLVSRRWLWVVWMIALGWVLVAVSDTFGAARLQDIDAANPLAVGGSIGGFLNALQQAVVLGILGGILAAGSLVIRFRRAREVERKQIEWLAYAAVIVALGLVVTTVLESLNQTAALNAVENGIGTASLACVPVAMGIAILWRRLYDIDLVVKKTVVFGALAAFITAVYVGIAVGIGALIGGGGKPNLGLSIVATAIVAVGFQPVRERVQSVANRLVYGKRATPYEVLSQFSERVAESYAADDVMPRMARVLAEGTGAQRADVWLRSGNTWRDAAVWPLDAALAEPVPMAEGTLPPTTGANRLVEVRHQGDLLGALGITKRSGEALTPVEENLLSHLAGQAGLVLKNVGLTSNLHARLDELRASRQRLVTAQDEERRRLERNLHDGAQQHLVAIKLKLGLAEMLIGRDPDKARLTFDQLKSDADEALETLRDLARGIYPPLLADKGLQVALESQARKATVPVTVDADGIGRYSQEVEAVVYFCVLEALQNVQKYAHASRAVVRVHEVNGRVTFEVADDGGGFDVVAAKRGAGLTNMADRLDALAGALHVNSSIGQGTTIVGSLDGAAARVLAVTR